MKVSAWIRSPWWELRTPARVLADSERIGEHIVERQECLNYSGVSSRYGSWPRRL